MKKTDVMVIGSGGREDAVCKALAASCKVGKVYCAPGNGGMDCTTVDIKATDIAAVVEFAKTHGVGMVAVTSDDPLAMGMVDALDEAGIAAFGPTKAAAKLEWSKAYSKEFMQQNGIPTAAFASFSDYESARAYVEKVKLPVVVKADGLALGKGVLICQTRDEAFGALDEIMVDKKFGGAGDCVIVEEMLYGYETSLFAFCDGENYAVMPTACDHKRAFDNDEGLNTGGMGAYAPCPMFSKSNLEFAKKHIIEPTLAAKIKEGAPFKGVLFVGLMVDGDDVRVLEYNARFGDPETQAILPMLDTDLFDIMTACIDGSIDSIDVKWKKGASVCVVMASGGYPESYGKGYPIKIEKLTKGARVYFAGVKREGDTLVTSGGRVLAVQAIANDGETAAAIAYENVDNIHFEKAHYRHDIYNPKK